MRQTLVIWDKVLESICSIVVLLISCNEVRNTACWRVTRLTKETHIPILRSERNPAFGDLWKPRDVSKDVQSSGFGCFGVAPWVTDRTTLNPRLHTENRFGCHSPSRRENFMMTPMTESKWLRKLPSAANKQRPHAVSHRPSPIIHGQPDEPGRTDASHRSTRQSWLTEPNDHLKKGST